MLNWKKVQITLNGVLFNLVSNLHCVGKHIFTRVSTHSLVHFISTKKMNVKLIKTHHAICTIKVVKTLERIFNLARLVVSNFLLKLSMSIIDKHDLLNYLLIYRRMMAVGGNDDLVTCGICQINQSTIHSFSIVRHYFNVKVFTESVCEPLKMFFGNCIVVHFNSLIDEARHTCRRNNKTLTVLLKYLKVDARLSIKALSP